MAMQKAEARITQESFERLCTVDAAKFSLVSDLRGGVFMNDQHGNNVSTPFRQERARVALAGLRCASAVPPRVSLPPGIKPIPRKMPTRQSLRTPVLARIVRQKVKNCWDKFGLLAEADVEREMHLARFEIEALEEQKMNGGLCEYDRQRIRFLKAHRDKMRKISTGLKEISKPKNIQLSKRDKERLRKLNDILAEKAKVRQQEKSLNFDGETASPLAEQTVYPRKRKKLRPSSRHAKRMRYFPLFYITLFLLLILLSFTFWRFFFSFFSIAPVVHVKR